MLSFNVFANQNLRRPSPFGSCENCRVSINNSHFGIYPSMSSTIPVLSFHALMNCPLLPHKKTDSLFSYAYELPFRKSFPLTFVHRMGGVPPQIRSVSRITGHRSRAIPAPRIMSAPNQGDDSL